ncbi:hypothetical protein V6N13_091488 [Hibiscus sabdariffa]
MLRCFFSFLIAAPINEISYFSCDSCQPRRLLRLLLLLHVSDGYRRPVASFIQTALICNSRFKLSQWCHLRNRVYVYDHLANMWS